MKNKSQIEAVTTEGQPITLAQAKQISEEVSPQVLESYLNTAKQNCYAFELRLKIATEAQDKEQVEKISKDENFAKWKKRRAYFGELLEAKFPKHKPGPANFKPVEQQIIVNEYLNALRLKRDAQIHAEAAKVLEDETERKMAVQELQRVLRYLRYLEPKFKKFEKELGRNDNPN